MKKIILIALIVLCYALGITKCFAELNAVGEKPDQPSYAKIIQPDKLKEDLDFLFKTIEEVHPNMYAYTSKEEFIPLQNELYRQINQPMNRLEFYKLVAPVVASLKNGHTFLKPPYTFFQNYAINGGKYFPLEMQVDDDKVILIKYTGPYNLPLGAEVLTIDNENAIEFLRKAARYSPSEGRTYNLAMLQREGRLAMYLWLEKRDAESLELQIKTNSEQAKKYCVKALGYEELVNYQKSNTKKIEAESEPDGVWYTYRYIPKHNAGLIEFNLFHGRELFKGFLRDTFAKIQEQNITNLIIDIRKNPGGSSSLGDDLLEYLTDKPFLQFEKNEIKISTQLLETQQWIKQEYPDAEIGSIISVKPRFILPGDNPLRFNGKVFVLIGPKTASSSVSFASTIKHFHIGTLIGQETIDTTVNYGDCVPGKMPNSGLDFSVAGKRFVEVGGKPDGRGVIPNYEVKQKPEDTAKGVDTALQFTLNLIKTGEAEK